MGIAVVFLDRLVAFVLAPMREALPPGTSLIYTNPPEAFALHFNIAWIAGTLLTAPFITFQIWRFIAPGLYSNEKRYVVPFVLLTSMGAVSGAAFSHYVAFPYMMVFFGTFSSSDLVFMPSVQNAFRMYFRMIIGMAVVFQIPTIVFFLAKMRLVTARFLWRNMKYAVLAIFTVAAVLTPSPDPWNQALFAVPMIGLYLVSIGIAWLVEPKRDESVANSNAVPLVVAVAVLDQARKSDSRSSLRVVGKR
jgi:sec-independent protein translocase protein TatC